MHRGFGSVHSEVMDDNLSPLRRPTELPAVRHPRDLYDRWRTLITPLGFSRRTMWFAILDADGVMSPQLTQIDDLPAQVGLSECLPLLEMIDMIVSAVMPTGSAALLYTRPGRDAMNDDDRSWGRSLTAAAETVSVSLWPVHFANDRELKVFAPDELGWPRAS